MVRGGKGLEGCGGGGEEGKAKAARKDKKGGGPLPEAAAGGPVAKHGGIGGEAGIAAEQGMETYLDEVIGAPVRMGAQGVVQADTQVFGATVAGIKEVRHQQEEVVFVHGRPSGLWNTHILPVMQLFRAVRRRQTRTRRAPAVAWKKFARASNGSSR